MGNKEILKSISDLMDERAVKNETWVKQILLMASGLIGILISLHKNRSEDICEHYIFVTTIALIGLGILSGSIYLYESIDTNNRMVRQLKKYLSLSGESQNEKLIFLKPSIFYVIMKYVFYASLILSIPSLVIYAMVIDV